MGIWVVPQHRTRNPAGHCTAMDPGPKTTLSYSSSAVSSAGPGASADTAIDLTGTPPERESTWAQHAAQRTKGTSNKPRVGASFGANASASVNANPLNANVVEDCGGSYITEGQRDRAQT